MEIALAALSAALAGVVAVGVSWRAFRLVRTTGLERQVAEAVATTLMEAPQLAKPPGQDHSESFVYADYVDEKFLQQLADAKRVSLEAVELTIGTSETRGEALTSQAGVSLGLPGLGDVSTAIGTEERRDETFERSVGFQRRPSVRAVVNELIAALDREGSLRRDLALVPNGAQDEATLIRQLRGVLDDWGLIGVPDDHPNRPLAEAIQTVQLAAAKYIAALKAEDYKEIDKSKKTTFGLVLTEWLMEQDAEFLSLINSRLLLDERGMADIGVASLIRVPLQENNLLSSNKQRYQPGNSRPLQVFGRIEILPPEGAPLILTPIVIFSA